MTLAEVFAKLPADVTITDDNNESFLVCDVDPSDDPYEYILDGDEIVRMDDECEYRRGVMYRVTLADAGLPAMEKSPAVASEHDT